MILHAGGGCSEHLRGFLKSRPGVDLSIERALSSQLDERSVELDLSAVCAALLKRTGVLDDRPYVKTSLDPGFGERLRRYSTGSTRHGTRGARITDTFELAEREWHTWSVTGITFEVRFWIRPVKP